ncbi:MAG: ABC transporter permease [Aureliella sp.]
MKAFNYIWRNITRNKLRSILTILSIGFSLALMTVLYGYIVMQGQWGIQSAQYHRIVVMSSQGFAGMLPIAYVDRVRTVSGVKDAVPYSWFGGDYKDQKMPFAQFATDPKHAFNVWDELAIDPEQLAAWQADRRGCVADRRLAERFGWQIGERIPLRGTFRPMNLELTLRGTFLGPMNTDMLWFDWEYLDELTREKASNASGNAGTIWAKTVDADMATVSKVIDDKFSSSENPTRTQTEAAFAQIFTDMLGDIQAYIRYIGMAVVVSLLLVAGNAMAMSMRERTTEIAVLKAIGFSKARVLWMIVGESVAIATLGGLLGVAIGCGLLEGLHHLSVQMIPISIMDMLGVWILLLILTAAAIGFVSGMVPAIRAAQLSVIDGLRRVV